MEKALPVTFYNQDMYNVRSDAQPGLKGLTLTLGPIGIGLYQGTVKLDIFGWMEIWNVGYMNRIFWFRILRDGEKSKHKYHFMKKKLCKYAWKQFRSYFSFYTQEKKIDPKLLWGRIPPKVSRVNLNAQQHEGWSESTQENKSEVEATCNADNLSLHENVNMKYKPNHLKMHSNAFIVDPALMEFGRLPGTDNDIPARILAGLYGGNSRSKFNSSTGISTGQPPRVQFSDRT